MFYYLVAHIRILLIINLCNMQHVVYIFRISMIISIIYVAAYSSIFFYLMLLYL
jgi:hypothetical protein